MRAITVHNPWAWAICHAGKDIENRVWWRSSLLGEQLAIHAGMRLDKPGLDYLARLGVEAPTRFDNGAIVGLATISEAHHSSACRRQYDSQWYPCSRWAMGPNMHHWHLTDVRVLPVPVPCRGAQQIWTVPEDKAAQVLGQLVSVSTGGQ